MQSFCLKCKTNLENLNYFCDPCENNLQSSEKCELILEAITALDDILKFYSESPSQSEYNDLKNDANLESEYDMTTNYGSDDDN